jgi:hypothetical protein
VSTSPRDDVGDIRAARGVGHRRRSARYPAASLSQTIAFVRGIEARRTDGTTAEAIARATGYRNIRTRSFSARLSSARQFGLLGMHRGIYTLTERGRALAKPTEADDKGSLMLQAFLAPPLYAELALSLAGRPLPDAAALASRLERGHEIAPAARERAAEVFLASAREAGVVDSENVLRLGDGGGTEVVRGRSALASGAGRVVRDPSAPRRRQVVAVVDPCAGIDDAVQLRAPGGSARGPDPRRRRSRAGMTMHAWPRPLVPCGLLALASYRSRPSRFAAAGL